MDEKLEVLGEAYDMGYGAQVGLMENSPISPVSVVFLSMLWIEDGADSMSDLFPGYALSMPAVGLSGIFLFLPFEFIDTSDKGILCFRRVCSRNTDIYHAAVVSAKVGIKHM